MSEIGFHETAIGRRFLEHTMPELARQVRRLTEGVERLTMLQNHSAPAVDVFPEPGPIEVGSLVRIVFNPHCASGTGAVGRVVAFREGEGHGGIDLFDVRYTDPQLGVVETKPFGERNLQRVQLPDLEGLAAHYLRKGTTLSLVRCEVRENVARRGGGIAFSGSMLELRGSEFVANNATQSGGLGGFGGGLHLAGGGSALLDGCRFVDGLAAVGGAGIHAVDAAILSGSRVEFLGHRVSGGTGAALLLQDSSTVDLQDCYFHDNIVSNGGDGGVLYLTGSAQVSFRRSTLVDNRAPGGDGGGCYLAGGQATFTGSLLWDNRSVDNNLGETAAFFLGGGSMLVDYCCVQGWTGTLPGAGVGNLGGGAFDPTFVDPASDDYHLSVGSPCIGRGDPNALVLDATDRDGEARIRGPRVDIGADEVHDCNGNGIPDRYDIASGTSQDANGDLVPDECPAPIAPQAAPAGLRR